MKGLATALSAVVAMTAAIALATEPSDENDADQSQAAGEIEQIEPPPGQDVPSPATAPAAEASVIEQSPPDARDRCDPSLSPRTGAPIPGCEPSTSVETLTPAKGDLEVREDGAYVRINPDAAAEDEVERILDGDSQ